MADLQRLYSFDEYVSQELAKASKGWYERRVARIAIIANQFEEDRNPSPRVEDRYQIWWHAPAKRVITWLRLR